ncbi:MAG: OmpA family protein [Hyphomicrobium sp.]|nr:OmpA family protein [Hyphomicrobium sp.]
MKPTNELLIASVTVLALAATMAAAEPTPATPAWQAEATMNPDYVAGASPASNTPATESETVLASDELPPQTPPGRTDFYGTGTSTVGAPFAAEAIVNPDNDAAAAEPATAPEASPVATPAVASEEALPPQTPPGRTDFYGSGTSTVGAPFAAGATANPAYSAPAAASASAATRTASSCRDALNAELASGTINFGIGSYSVLPSSYRSLDKIAATAKSCSDALIEVGGHTDTAGSIAGNAKISELRAKAVVKYLTRAGVEAAKLRAVGYGATKPIASNDTPAGRRQNRRIEFVVSQ